MLDIVRAFYYLSDYLGNVLWSIEKNVKGEIKKFTKKISKESPSIYIYLRETRTTHIKLAK